METVIKQQTVIKLLAEKLGWMDITVNNIFMNEDGDFIIDTEDKIRQRAKCNRKIKRTNRGLSSFITENWVMIPGHKQGFHVSKLLLIVQKKFPTVTKKYLIGYISRSDRSFPFYFDKEMNKIMPTYKYLISCSR